MEEQKDKTPKNIRKRKSITEKTRLKVFFRDNFTCQTCGKNRITHPGLSLEIDHKIPHSKGGTDDIPNLQTLCFGCNRGKGNDEALNRTIKNDLDIYLNYVNPDIIKHLNCNTEVRVVSTDAEFSEIYKQNSYGNFYEIKIIPNTIMGFNAGKNLGIYTLNDNGGSKTNFHIKKTLGKNRWET